MDEREYVTEAEFAHWLTPSQALDALCEPWQRETWVAEINKRIRSGLVRIAVETISEFHGSTEDQDALFVVPANWWKETVAPFVGDPFWTTGGLTIPPPGGMRVTAADRVVLFGAKLDPAIRKLAPQASRIEADAAIAPVHQTTPAKNRGGAPRMPFWDPLWIEMIRRIRAGTLKPKSSPELEGMMEDWLDEQGFKHGEGTVHRTALNLFKYLKEK